MNARSITTTDTFRSTEYGSPLVRFLLDPSIDVVKRADGSVRLSRENFNALARFSSSKPDAELRVEVRESWVAFKNHRVAKTKELLISIPESEQKIEIVSSFVEM